MTSHGPDGTALREAPLHRPPAIRQVRRRSRGWIAWAVVTLVLAGGAAGYWFIVRPMLANRAATSAKQSGGGGSRSVPVVAATAHKGDLPIYVNGLGTVTPFNLVTVRTRVGGEVTQVAFEEGQDVKEGDLLAQIDLRPFEVQLEEAQGQAARDEAFLGNAKSDLDRYQSAGTAVSQQQIDTAAAQVRQYEATIKSDQAAINNAKLQLTYCRITAPITGRIGLRRVDRGNIVQANDVNGLAVITQLQPIAMVFSISQDDASAVLRKPRGGVGLTVDAFDRGFTEKLATGTIAAIDNQIDSSTGTLRIKASFANKDGVLFPNQFVNARLLLETLHDAILVPSAAVQRGPDGDFVYAVTSDQAVEVRPVKVGATTGEFTAIESGVQAGDVLVTDGVDKLQPGAKVSVRERGQGGATTRATTRSDAATSQPAGGGSRRSRT
jgi:multidrug efflux system membrane fusion protein